MASAPKEYLGRRAEQRMSMSVAVHLSGHQQSPGVETAFTENVSSRGARVISTRRSQTEDRLNIALLPGDFRANARVAYCHPLQDEGYAVGLEFLEPVGRWVLNRASVPGNNLQG
jgi:PilZ domain